MRLSSSASRPPSAAQRPPRQWGTTIFEQVILINSAIIVASALAAYLVTHMSYEPYHYLIDTLFVLLATVAGVGVNAFFLQRAFRPLFGMLTTIEAVQSGHVERRAPVDVPAADIAEIARAFNAMLDALETSRRAGLRAVAQAQEAERRRLALELHDATGQELTALILRLELVRQELDDAPADMTAATGALAETMGLAQRSLQGVRTLAQQLRPTVLDDMALSAAIRWLASELQHGTALRIVVHAREAATPTTEQEALAETMLFRVAQEALTNAVRHSQAHAVHISLQRTNQELTLQVRDDGCGFVRAAHPMGTGLSSMQERMALVGGRCLIRSSPGNGTTITACVPLLPAGGPA